MDGVHLQFTQLPNQNVAVVVIGDEHPGAALKFKLAQFSVGEVVKLGAEEVEIEGVTMRPSKGYNNAYTQWHIHYYVRYINAPRREASPSETDLLMFNPQPLMGTPTTLLFELYTKLRLTWLEELGKTAVGSEAPLF